MMRNTSPIATRWRDERSPPTPDLQATQQLFADVQEFGSPSDVALHRLRARLHQPAKPWVQRITVVQFASAVIVLLLAAGASAVYWPRGPRSAPPTPKIAPPVAAPSVSPPAAPTGETLVERAPPKKTQARISRPSTSDSLTKETQLLGDALMKLRQVGDAAGALRALDRYNQSFPHGVLSAEAKTARIDALLALGQKRKALALLAQLDLSAWPRGDELRLLRANLWVDAGDCRRAQRDFSVLLAKPVVPAVRLQAIQGQARCAHGTP